MNAEAPAPAVQTREWLDPTPEMNGNHVRAILDALASQLRNHDAAATIELAREFFTNPDFRKALEQHVWEINQGEGR